jgi:pyridoxal biosynthesis lyase PdxS
MMVQIYEIQTPEEAAMLERLGVDHIGVLVGDGAFPRELSTDRASAIFAALPKTDGADGNGKDLHKVRRFVTAAKLTTSRQ